MKVVKKDYTVAVDDDDSDEEENKKKKKSFRFVSRLLGGKDKKEELNNKSHHKNRKEKEEEEKKVPVKIQERHEYWNKPLIRAIDSVIMIFLPPPEKPPPPVMPEKVVKPKPTIHNTFPDELIKDDRDQGKNLSDAEFRELIGMPQNINIKNAVKKIPDKHADNILDHYYESPEPVQDHGFGYEGMLPQLSHRHLNMKKSSSSISKEDYITSISKSSLSRVSSPSKSPIKDHKFMRGLHQHTREFLEGFDEHYLHNETSEFTSDTKPVISRSQTKNTYIYQNSTNSFVDKRDINSEMRGVYERNHTVEEVMKNTERIFSDRQLTQIENDSAQNAIPTIYTPNNRDDYTLEPGNVLTRDSYLKVEDVIKNKNPVYPAISNKSTNKLPTTLEKTKNSKSSWSLWSSKKVEEEPAVKDIAPSPISTARTYNNEQLQRAQSRKKLSSLLEIRYKEDPEQEAEVSRKVELMKEDVAYRNKNSIANYFKEIMDEGDDWGDL